MTIQTQNCMLQILIFHNNSHVRSIFLKSLFITYFINIKDVISLNLNSSCSTGTSTKPELNCDDKSAQIIEENSLFAEDNIHRRLFKTTASTEYA
ncbi:hypothetical protein CDAR_503571 [Caerostris darwini]|uniref:Uncharacterized protein n=1 Tax=Caerostris darwini TaxID=1538125 RepID=A0AAV4NQL2_9ARAC|nr:hypothetical protein CDAR_503571 [Caerostris darwini]